VSFHDAATPEDTPDYEFDAEIARLERHTTETEEGDDDADERTD